MGNEQSIMQSKLPNAGMYMQVGTETADQLCVAIAAKFVTTVNSILIPEAATRVSTDCAVCRKLRLHQMPFFHFHGETRWRWLARQASQPLHTLVAASGIKMLLSVVINMV